MNQANNGCHEHCGCGEISVEIDDTAYTVASVWNKVKQQVELELTTTYKVIRHDKNHFSIETSYKNDTKRNLHQVVRITFQKIITNLISIFR